MHKVTISIFAATLGAALVISLIAHVSPVACFAGGRAELRARPNCRNQSQ